MKKGLIASTIAVALVLLAVTSIATTLKERKYDSHISIGQGKLPEVDFGIYTSAQGGDEITSFNYTGLNSNSRTEFTYYLRQKSSYNITAFVRWGFSCLPISYITMEMLWRNEPWSYTESKAWNTTDVIPMKFVIYIGDATDTSWDFVQNFVVSTTP